MRRRFRNLTLVLLVALLACGLVLAPLFRIASAQETDKQIAPAADPKAAQKQNPQLGEAAARQIQALVDEKESRTEAQKKLSSRLIYALKGRNGEAAIASQVNPLRSAADVDKTGAVAVDIRADKIDKELIEVIEKVGGQIIYVSERGASVRARVPLDALENLASFPAVKFIRPAVQARTLNRPAGRGEPSPKGPSGATALPGKQITPTMPGKAMPMNLSADFAARAARVRTQVANSLAALPVATSASLRAPRPALSAIGAATSEGDVAHRAMEARNFFGVNGAGVKIGVLSDSVDFLAQVQATGDLPPDVTVLPGQSGVPGSGEGTAMLEIVHDLAPGAKLYFATAFTSDVSFADNIRALRAAGCDIIVDDVIYANESPFQDNVIAKAVTDVTDDGALYFSSAGNEGNFNDGTSSVWEGDFKNGGTLSLLPGGNVHDFGSGVISDRVESSSPFVLALFWSDPFGASSNDYDLFILNSTLTTVLDASTDIQDGSGDPFEILNGAFAGERVVVLKKTGAERRALHINNFGGQLGISTSGQTHGHSAVAKAFGVAAVDVAEANGGAFTGGPTNPVELYSSDGRRRVFYQPDGTPYTPGKLLFSNGGGELRKKPDVSAADGVTTTTPGFDPFFGTSAAAPHAAAIAALVKSARPSLSQNRIRRALTQTALDIEAAGVDRDSGYGILDAFAALQSIGAAPAPFIELGTITAVAVGGDNDIYIEPGESGRLAVQLINNGGATALGINAALTTTTPGVTITQGTSSYPNIGSNGASAFNNTPFTFNLAGDAPCGLTINFTLTVTVANSSNSPYVFDFTVQTGQPSASAATVSYTGPAVPIPDSNAAGVEIPLNVSGFGNISDLNFSFDGSGCTSAAGATTVGLDHTWVGDLVITLTSPQGTTVTLMSRPGGALNSGNNFCNTLLDDEGGSTSIQSITSAGAPYTGTYKPAGSLAAFKGQNPNGTWKLKVSDNALTDTGNVRAFSLRISSFNCN